MFSSYQNAILYLVDYYGKICPDDIFGKRVEEVCSVKGAAYMVHKIYAVSIARVFNDMRKAMKVLAEE